eukprot:6383597-Pyramimonas_sp.AAC.1
MINTEQDLVIKAALLKQLQELSKEITPPKDTPSPAEAVRRAEGVWKDAQSKYQQATQNVSRLRE